MNITRRLKSFTALALSLCMGLQFYPVLGEETTEPVTTDLSTSTSVDWALNTYTARNDGTAFSLGLTFVEGTVLHAGDTMSLALPEGYSFSDVTEALPLYAVRNGVPGELLGSYTISGNVLSLVFNEVTDLTGVTAEITVTGTETQPVTEGYYKEQTWTLEQDEDGTVNTVTFIVPSSDIMNWTWVSEDGTWTSTVDSIQETTDGTTTLALSNAITNTASYSFSLPEGIKAADANSELSYAPTNPDGTQSQSISIGTYSVTENTLTANVTSIPTEAVTVSLPFTWNTEPLPTATPEIVDEELVEAITEENEKLNETPAPTETPVVTATPEVTETPEPTETPVVTPTPEPTVTPTPVPTETPEAANNGINMMANGVETLADSIATKIDLDAGFDEFETNNYQNSGLRDIYWIDNNNGEGTRPTFDYITNNLDINNLTYTAQYSYTVGGQQNTGTITLEAAEINQLLVNKDLLDNKDIVLTNLGGTGHYTLGVNSLPGEVRFTKTTEIPGQEGQESTVTTENVMVTFTGWTLNQDPAKPIIQGQKKDVTYTFTDKDGNPITKTVPKEWTDQYAVLHVEWKDAWTDTEGEHPAGYYDQNGLIRPGAPDDGWFFVQKMDYQVNVLIRRGTNVFGNAEGLEWAVRNAYDFHWRTGITGSDGNDINEGKLPLTDAGMSIELLHETFGNAAELPTAVYLVKNLEKYNLNGSELIFCLEYDGSNKDEQGNPKDGVISYIPSAQNADNSWNMSSENQLKDGDYLDEEIVNDPVSNFGTATDKVYNGGQLILTLKGQTDYTAKKYWQDAADSERRPEVQFQLWRVTKKTTVNDTLRELYKSAAPVEPTAPQSENKSTTTATITIDSDNGDSQPISFAGLFNAKEGDKYLAKYDPEGYTYEYFTREIVNYKEGDNQYRTVYGAPDEYEDTLIYDGGREQNDNSIYDGGAITNILTGTTSAQVIKRWTADSFQSELGDVDVVFKLQSRVKGEENAEWTDVLSAENKPVTYTMGQSANTPFTAENLIRDYTGTFEKYNNDGQELEYKWVEYGVYQNDPGHTINLMPSNDDGTFTFTLRQKDQDVIYDSTSVVEFDGETGRYVTTVDNKIQDTTEYFVEKKWDPELNPQPIYLEMFRSDTSNRNFNLVDKDGNYFKMDGTAESEEDAVDLYVEGTQDVENPEVVGKVFEYKPWKAAFVDLKKYAPDGSPYDYIVLESQEGTSWAADYSVGSIESPFTGELVTQLTITNVPNPGNRIYVRKRWLDDGDEQHRGDVTFTAYKIKDGVNIEDFTFADLELIQLDENPAQVTVNRDVNWWSHIQLPAEIDHERLIILETLIGSTTPLGTATDLTAGYAGTASSTMTPDQLKALLHSIYDVQHPDNTTPAESNEFQYHTENHPYEAFYTMQHLEDVEFYTVTNRRLGTVNINVTKNWLDGSEGTALSENRQNLIKALEDAGYQLVVKLVPSDIQDDDVSIKNIKIDYAKGTVNLGGRDVAIDNANGEDTHRAILPIDNNSNTSTYHFHGLPKYNTLGKLVRYDVIEGAQMKGTTEVVTIQEALKAAGVTGTFDYGFSKWQNSYVISDDHNTDTQTMTIQNKLSGTKDVHFWKEWDDAYRYNNGQRPDLYLTLYQYRQTGVDANNNKVMSMVEKYQDVHWESTGVNIWEYTFSNMEKYDDYGNEIMYYADEGISVDYKDFDYLDVYYKYLPTTTEAWDIDSDTFDATTAHNAIHTATSIGTRKGYSSPDTTDDGTLRTIGNGIYVLREDGIFVNRLQANVRISGQKIWANVPEGFLEADLVPVVFKVYQFNKAKGDKLPTDNYQPSVEEIENPAGDYKKRVYAFINISDWSNQKNSKGLYRFELQYKGENANVVNEDDSITVSLITRDEEGNIIANPADSTMIPKYDDAGNIYTYILREAGDFSGSDVDGNTNLVFKQPSLNDFAITNTYDSITGQIKVKKILDTSAYSPGELETIKVQNPSISFRLERYYEDTQVQNKMVLDEKFSVEKTIRWNEFVENKKEIIFENLEIYAPNGNRYRYVVIENPEENPLIDGGYTVFGTVGDGEVTGNYQEITPSETGEYVLDQKESAPLYPVEVKNGLLDKIGGFFRGIGEAIGIVERKVAVDNSMATFKNVYTKEYAPLEFSKTWNDTGGTNLRFATALTFDLSYINPGQEGQGNEWANYKKAGSITLEISNENISNDRKSATLEVKSGLFINVDPNLDSPENPIKQVVKVTITPVGDDTKTLDTATEWKYRIENLPIYSPSGVAWQYKLQETKYDPYIADTAEKTFTYKEPTGTESVGIFTTSTSNFNNSLSVDIRATKNVVDSDNPNTNYTGSGAENADFYNYTGYRIDVIYDLYAKFVVADNWSDAVGKFYLDPEGDNKSTNWMNLTEDTFAKDYPNIKAAFYTALRDSTEKPIVASTKFSLTQEFDKYDSFSQVSQTIYGLPKAFNISFNENGETVNKVVFASYALLETQVNLVDVDNGNAVAYRETLTPNFVQTTVPESSGDGYWFSNISYENGENVVAYWFKPSAEYLREIKESPSQDDYQKTDYLFMKPRFDEEADVLPGSFCEDYKDKRLEFKYEEHLPYIWIDETVSSSNSKHIFINDQFNEIDTTTLKVTKKWSEDNNNIYGTRYPAGITTGNWTVDYQLQQSDGNNVWTDYNLEKDFYKVITGTDENNEVFVEYSNLPANGVVRVYTDGKVTGYEAVGKYKYRVLEKNTDTAGTPIDDKTSDPDGIYNSTYEVTYDNDYTDTEQDGPNVSITNKLLTIDVKATKNWEAEERGLTRPVTFQIQYATGTNNDGKYEWETFTKGNEGKVTLNGEKDEESAYYENEQWHAVWKGLPLNMPGSVTEKVKIGDEEVDKTIYRVVEIIDVNNAYVSDYTGKVEGTGTTDDPYVYVLQETTGTQSSLEAYEEAYSIKNELTTLKLSKSIMLPKELGAGDSATIKPEILNTDFTFSISEGSIPESAKYEVYEIGTSGHEGVVKLSKLDSKQPSIKLKHNQYALIYGLLKGTPYTITESVEGYKAHYSYTYTVTAGDDPVKTTDGSMELPQDKPETIPILEVENERRGKVTIHKKDSNGEYITTGNIEFTLTFTEKGKDDPTVVTAKTNKDGIAEFTDLPLETEYTLKETSAPGYNKYPKEIHFKLPYESDDSNGNYFYSVKNAGEITYFYPDISFTIENDKAFVMPVTSGTGFFWPGMIGVAVSVLSAGGYVVTRKKKKREEEENEEVN